MTTTSPGVRHFTKDQLVRVARLFATDPDLASRIDRTATERQRLILSDTPHLEVLLMSWPAGASTGWHDHGDASGAFVVVEGILGEEVWRGGSITEHDLRAGDERSFGSGHLHTMTNLGDDVAVSVHAYSPGLTEMTPYEWVDNKPVPVAVD